MYYKSTNQFLQKLEDSDHEIIAFGRNNHISWIVNKDRRDGGVNP